MLAYFPLLLVAISEIHTQIVETPIGTIKGKTVNYNNESVEAYLGIPYAKPPIGPLRFRRTVPMDPFLEPIDAVRFGASCMQYTHRPWPDYKGKLNEDCLFLNIWTPVGAKDSELKAVVFFIHGGCFNFGSSLSVQYDGRVLAKEGDVIVVNFNYRSGPLGFLDFGISEAAGNMGLYDILEALKWVNKNIGSFGGDKNRITIFGESCGAITAGVFCISPLSKGLFQRVAMCGGAPSNMRGEDNNLDYNLSYAIAEEVGCLPSEAFEAESVVECLRGINSTEFTSPSDNETCHFYFKYGDEIVPSNTRQALINGDFRGADVLIGVSDGDGSHVITQNMPEIFGPYGEKEPQINKTLAESILRQYFKDFENPDALVQQYLEHVPDDHYEDIRFQIPAAVGDYGRICPSVYFAESLAEKSDNVYFYFFTHHTERAHWPAWTRATHAEDILYYFGLPLRRPDVFPLDEQSLSREMVQLLSNFAKYGKPAENWISYSKDSHVFKYLDTTEHGFGIGPDFSNCEFFRPYFGY